MNNTFSLHCLRFRRIESDAGKGFRNKPSHQHACRPFRHNPSASPDLNHSNDFFSPLREIVKTTDFQDVRYT
jgi:hypothetical protein